ncbi:hypothetical protein C2G38_2028568 [Gigaspora rosea]|uniref:Uncharacterized protein n=1 Tax=Gigaspora rosea TaxID=44941 RepID=A0A397W9Z0_9GLOM|nr:hypothetical protein C2G38_2028568 [Gigaspora rosea]
MTPEVLTTLKRLFMAGQVDASQKYSAQDMLDELNQMEFGKGKKMKALSNPTSHKDIRICFPFYNPGFGQYQIQMYVSICKLQNEAKSVLRIKCILYRGSILHNHWKGVMYGLDPVVLLKELKRLIGDRYHEKEDQECNGKKLYRAFVKVFKVWD